MKLFKKCLSVILVLVMLVGIVPFSVSASGGGSSFENAMDLTLGTTIGDIITNSYTERYYKFSISSSGEVDYKFINPEELRMNIGIYNSSYDELYSNTIYGKTESDSIDLIAGIYYIRVYKDYYCNTGSYSLETSFKSANETYTDDNSSFLKASEITLGNTFNGQIACNRTNDYYKFNISSSGKVNYKFINPEELRMNIGIYNSSYDELYSSTIYGKTESDSIDLIAGIYYIRVYKDYYCNTGSYSLETSFKSANETYTDDNSSFLKASEITLGKKINGQIACNRTNDYYKFNISSSGKIKYTFTNPEGLRMNIGIYNSSYDELYSGTIYGKTESDSVDLTEGIYYIRVYKDYYCDTGSYSLKVSLSLGSLDSAHVYLSTYSYTYDGNAKKPSVIVYLNSIKLSSSDYKVTYSNNVTPGRGKVKVKGKGDYTGSNTVIFYICPKSTSLVSVKAKKRAFYVKWKKQSTQTTGYKIQYSTNSKFSGAKEIKIGKNTKLSYTVKNLRAKKKYYVRVRTYKTNGKYNYLSDWSKFKSVKTKK